MAFGHFERALESDRIRPKQARTNVGPNVGLNVCLFFWSPLETGSKFGAHRELGRSCPDTIADRSVSQQSEFGCPQHHVGVEGGRLRHLQPYAGLGNIDGSCDGKFVIAASIMPSHSDVVLTRPPVLAAQIVPGSHIFDPHYNLRLKSGVHHRTSVPGPSGTNSPIGTRSAS